VHRAVSLARQLLAFRVQSNDRLSRIVGTIFFNHTATPEIYTLSLHDALPISSRRSEPYSRCVVASNYPEEGRSASEGGDRSEEHTSELQSLTNLVCRLLL